MKTLSTTFLSDDPFGTEFHMSLQEDLQEAEWARFQVCYFTVAGLTPMREALVQAMRHPLSRGLVTLTCSCRYNAMLSLWKHIDETSNRLRIFVPLDVEKGEEDAKLIHTKMVVIVKRRVGRKKQRVVLYTGSHNWTGPGIRTTRGPGAWLNVESSIRIEAEWESEWLEQATQTPLFRTPQPNPVVDALRLMQNCFGLKSSWPLESDNIVPAMDSWLRAKCSEVQNPPSTSIMVCTAVLGRGIWAHKEDEWPQDKQGAPPTLSIKPDDLVYVQHFRPTGSEEEPETFESNTAWAIYCWRSKKGAIRADPPAIILATVENLGATDTGNPELAGFRWVLFDPRHNSKHASRADLMGHVKSPPVYVPIKSGQMDVWSLSKSVRPPTTRRLTKKQIDRSTPHRSILLKVVKVIPPDSSAPIPWQTAKNRKRDKNFAVPGSADTRETLPRDMIHEQVERFGVGVSRAKWQRWSQNDRSTSQQERTPHQSAVDHFHAEGPTDDQRLLTKITYTCEAGINAQLFADSGEQEPFEATAKVYRESFGTYGNDIRRRQSDDFAAVLVPTKPAGPELRIPRIKQLQGPEKKRLAKTWRLTQRERKALKID